jgi:hypothetical protein
VSYDEVMCLGALRLPASCVGLIRGVPLGMCLPPPPFAAMASHVVTVLSRDC